MKKLIIISLAMFVSCKSEKEKKQEQRMKDSITAIVMDRMGDNIIERNFNNSEIKKAPIKILSGKFIPREYSNDKDVEVFYKNVSKKNIVAVKFQWYGENIYGEAADMGVSAGYGCGSSEQLLVPGQEAGVTWDIFSSDGKNIIGSKPIEVVFEDGTKWQIQN